AQVGATDLNRPTNEHKHEQEKEKKQKYTCPMHPEVVTEHPGNCPKCGMKLVSETDEKRSTSNHQSHLSHPSREMHPHSHGSGAAGEHEMMAMHSSIDLTDPMSREGSGTSWLPDSSPMY